MKTISDSNLFMHLATNSKQSVPLRPTRDLLENNLICLLLTRRKCSLEFKRYYAMANWALLFGGLLNWSGTLLTAYLDKFIQKANNYTPPILIDF